MKAKKVARDSLITLGITLAFLIGCELLLRVLFPDKTKVERPFVAYQFNEDYLFSLKPNFINTYVRSPENGGDIISWRSNKDGFRGNPLNSDSRFRIMVYGDFNIQGRFSKLENTFAFKLQKYINETRSEKVEVINAGVIGFGPDQSLIRFKKEYEVYQPDLVVFHIFADNDFGDLIRNRLFELDLDGNLVQTTHKKKVDPHLKTSLMNRFSFLLIFRAASKIKGLLTPRKLETKKELIEQFIATGEEEYSVYEKGKPKYFSHLADHYDFDIALFPQSESADMKLKLMHAILREVKGAAAARGVGLVALIQPSVVDLTKNFQFNYEDLKKYPGYDRRRLTNAVNNICVKNQILKINLFDVFLRNRAEELFFKRNNNHWNDRGQDLAAKETAQLLMREAWRQKAN